MEESKADFFFFPPRLTNVIKQPGGYPPPRIPEEGNAEQKAFWEQVLNKFHCTEP